MNSLFSCSSLLFNSLWKESGLVSGHTVVRWKQSSGLEVKDSPHHFTYSASWGGQTCTGCLKDEHKINLLVVVPIMRHTKVKLLAAFQTALQVSHPGPADRRGSWQTQTPLSSCGRASMQRERMAGCKSREGKVPASNSPVCQAASPGGHHMQVPAPHTAQQGAAHLQLLLLSASGGSWGCTW